MHKMVIKVENVYKEFKNQVVLENINLQLEAGKIYGIIGRNGSGKSVLLKMIAGLLQPSDGSIYINGEMLKKGTYAKELGVIFDCTGFLPEYSAMENLLSLAKIRNIVGKEEIEEVLTRVGLEAFSDKLYRKFSLGMKQKLAIAQAFMEKPKILLLDEPMNSLDEESVEDMRIMFRDYVRENDAVMMITSHNREDIEVLCDNVYEIKKNKLISVENEIKKKAFGME